MVAVLKIPNFRRLWVAQVILSLGDALMQMGLLEFFRVHHYDERVETAKMLFAVSIGGVILGPVAIAYLGRWQRRMVLIVSDAIRAVLVVGILVWLLRGNTSTGQVDLMPVYGLVALIGFLATFYLPARSALLPNLVEKDMLLKANTLFATSLAISAVGGRALGGFVAEKFGVVWAVSSNIVTCIIATILVGMIKMEPHATTGGDQSDKKSGGWIEFKTGMLYLFEHPIALPLVILSAVFAFLLGILMVVFIGYANDTLGLRTGGIGYLIAAAGVGAGLGIALLSSGKSWTHSNWLPFGQLLISAGGLVLLSLTKSIWMVSAILVVLGAVAATVMIYLDAKLQEQVEDVRRGAVFAARGMLTSLTMIVAFWLQFGTEWFIKTPAPRVLFWLGIGSAVAAVLTVLLARSKKA